MEDKEQKKPDPLDAFLFMCHKSIQDDGGVKTMHGVFLKDDGIAVYAYLGLSSDQIVMSALGAIAKDSPEEGVFGLDRYSQPNQGVDSKWDSVVTLYYYTRKADESKWKFGVLPYNSATREVGELDWGNEFWIRRSTEEMQILVNKKLATR